MIMRFPLITITVNNLLCNTNAITTQNRHNLTQICKTEITDMQGRKAQKSEGKLI